MKLPEHAALSYLLAQFGVQQECGAIGTGLMVLAGNLPDLDGLTVLGGWRCHRRYHRVLGHGLPVTLFGPLLLALLGSAWLGSSLWFLWGWLQLSLLIHLATDVCFYRWPVQLGWPLTRRGPGFGWIGWNDLVPTLLLYAGVVGVFLWPWAPAWPAALSLGVLGAYVVWRAALPRGGGWLGGGWAQRAPRLCRWLTGDFVT
jgi:membrane-bound metal-dependent hydrolase YbcI (DUF457 family)